MRVRRLPIVEDLDFAEGTVVLTMERAQLLSLDASAVWKALSSQAWSVTTNVEIVRGLSAAGLVEIEEC